MNALPKSLPLPDFITAITLEVDFVVFTFVRAILRVVATPGSDGVALRNRMVLNESNKNIPTIGF